MFIWKGRILTEDWKIPAVFIRTRMALFEWPQTKASLFDFCFPLTFTLHTVFHGSMPCSPCMQLSTYSYVGTIWEEKPLANGLFFGVLIWSIVHDQNIQNIHQYGVVLQRFRRHVPASWKLKANLPSTMAIYLSRWEYFPSAKEGIRNSELASEAKFD